MLCSRVITSKIQGRIVYFMWTRIAWRLLASIPVCLAASVIVFFLLELAPGDPIRYLGDPDASLEAARAQAAVFGFEDPLPIRLGRWIASTLTLDFGQSILDHRPVRDKLLEALPHTLLLSGVSLIFGFILGIGDALVSVSRRESPGRGVRDAVISYAGVLFLSLPLFWIATWAAGWLSTEWKWFPPGGALSVESLLSPGWHIGDRIYHLILPAGILTIVTAAEVARYARASLLSTLEAEFIEAARARGASHARILLRHALPASLQSTIALFGMHVPWLFGGTAILEHIFNYPGTGRLLLEAMARRDYPVVCASVIVISTLAILGNALAEAVAIRVDPRTEGENV